MKVMSMVKFLACIFACVVLLASCGGVTITPNDGTAQKPGNGTQTTPVQLTAPVVILEGDVAKWNSSPQAEKFEISLNGTLLYLENTSTEKRLADGDIFKIRAVGDDVSYKTSEWSNSVTYNAQQALSQYTVVWKNGDSILEIDTGVSEGTMPVYNGETPVKSADAQYTYTFAGWSPSVDSITADTVYVAQFTSMLNTYIVTWKNGDIVLETDTDVPYGTTPIYNGEVPAKNDGGAILYTFSGWSPSISAVTGDVTYMAQFEDTINKHVVVFYDADGVTELGRVLVVHGEIAVYPNALPIKEASAQTVYTFEKWVSAIGGDTQADLTSITEDVSVYAKYTETVRTYTVTFCDWDGTVLSTVNVPFGDVATAPSAPVRENHRFIGWDAELHAIEAETVITARYEKIIIRTIIYENLKGADYPEFSEYAVHEGVAKLPEISVPGYNFLGWYTMARVDRPEIKIESIAPYDTETYILKAKWEAISYSIEYKDAPIHENPIEYTIETDTFKLKDASWSGLSFAYWTDENGTVVTEIEEGTIGHRVLTANWILLENMPIPSQKEMLPHIIFDEEHARYYFIYEIGMIDNVVLKTIEVQGKMMEETLTWTKSETVTVGKEIADTVAKAVSNSCSQTTGWDETKKWATNNQVGSSVSAGIETDGPVKAKLEATITASTEVSESKEYGVSNHNSFGSETSDSVSSTVAFSDSSSTTITTESVISAVMPTGIYSNVCVGTVRVYAIVTYDPEGQKFYVDSFSILDEKIREQRLYAPSSDSTANIVAAKGLDFSVPTGEITKYVDSVYSVRYNANGGSGSMFTSIIPVDAKQNLMKNQFERLGYIFTGWGLSTDGGVVYPDEAEIKNLVDSGEIITLYAVWEAIPYTVKWSSDVGYTISVQRSESPAGAFIGVISSGTTVYYGDVLTITYDYKIGYSPISGAEGDTEITVEGDVLDRIYTKATPNTYTVVYYPNDGNGTVTSSIHTYNESKALNPNQFSREQYEFLGWSTNASDSAFIYKDNESVVNLTEKNGASVELYAIWIKVEHTFTTDKRAIFIGDKHADTIKPELERDRLIENQFTALEVVIRVAGGQSGIFQDEPYIVIYSHTDQAITRIDLPDFDLGSSGQVHQTDVIRITLNNVQTDGSFWIQFGNDGGQYILGQVVVYIKAVR